MADPGHFFIGYEESFETSGIFNHSLQGFAYPDMLCLAHLGFLFMPSWLGLVYVSDPPWLGLVYVSDPPWLGLVYVFDPPWFGSVYISDPPWFGLVHVSDPPDGAPRQ